MSVGKIVDFGSLDQDEQHLVREAVAAREFAYCPYSEFAVGAAIRMHNDIVYRGCNVESCVYTPTICAERTAVCKAVSEGQRKIKSVAVVALQRDVFTAPCGVCRQVLNEFGDENVQILMSRPDMKLVMRVKMLDLLPLPFQV